MHLTRRRVGDAVGLEDLPHGGGGDAVPVADDFAVDPSIPPRQIVGRHLDHQTADRDCGGGSPRSPWPVGPVASDTAPVPTQQRVGSDLPTPSSRTRQGPGDRREQRPIVIGHCGLIDTPTKYGELTT